MQGPSPHRPDYRSIGQAAVCYHFYICQKVEQWLKSGGDPQGEYMVHLAEYAEKNVMEK